jgi:AcrR family transcriptional regulator
VTRPARPSLTERRAEELRFQIALAARDLFTADGDTSATVERICEVVGINPRTFHRHFPVKEDVVIPLFRRFGTVRPLEVLEKANRDADPIETLVHAFTTEIAERHTEELDRKFLTLIVRNPQYRLRWLDWGEEFVEPLTEFLANRFDLPEDPFLRTLPAQLIIHTCRQVYTRWVDTGDFSELEASFRAAVTMILSSLRPTVASPSGSHA